jgi:hypothetical protein
MAGAQPHIRVPVFASIAVAPRTDLEVIHRDEVNLDALRLEFDWHRKCVDCKNEHRLIPTKTSLDRKAKVLAAL